MPKKKIRKSANLVVSTSHELRNSIERYYTEKFFNKFLAKYEFEGLDYQQIAFIMRQFWGVGTIACHVLPYTDNEENPNGIAIFTPWVISGVYNIYNFPTEIRLINKRGVKFIPNASLPLDKEGGAVIGYIQKDHKSIYSTILVQIKKIVEIEMTIRTNLKAQKTPWLFGVDAENESKMQQLCNNLDSDDPKLFVPLENLQVAKALVSGAPYNIDKLEQQRQQAENEVLSRLGIKNIGVMEKKEHFTVDEVNASQEQTQSSSEEFLDMMTEFFDRCNMYLGANNLAVRLKEIECSQPQQDYEEEQEDE